jgi:hypothetical protein
MQLELLQYRADNLAQDQSTGRDRIVISYEAPQ